MKISVIIPTYNGANKILRALRSLEKQTHMPDEVVVVIDGSTDGTNALLQQQRFVFPFKIIEQPNGGRAQVRNRGAAEALYELLLFLDDDMIAGEELLSLHLKHHAQHPGTIVTGGLLIPEEQKKDDFYQFRSYLNDRWNAPLVGIDNGRMDEERYYITAGNFSISADTFKKLKGFDERLKDAEDYDMAVRAWGLNIPMYFSYAAVAYHREEVTCYTYIKRLRQYAEAQERLKTLKPELYAGKHRQAVAVPTGLKGSIFKFFAKLWWINSVDRHYWTWLPQPLRFKLYDVITTANGSYFTQKVSL